MAAFCFGPDYWIRTSNISECLVSWRSRNMAGYLYFLRRKSRWNVKRIFTWPDNAVYFNDRHKNFLFFKKNRNGIGKRLLDNLDFMEIKNKIKLKQQLF